MAATSYSLTLSGGIQRLSDAFGTQPPGVIDPALDIPYRTIVLQGPKAGADVFVGGMNQALTLSSSKFGVRLDPTASVPPVVIGGYDTGPIKLSDFYVLGTSTQVVTVLGIPF